VVCLFSIRSSGQAAELLRTLQSTLRQLGTCDGNLEDGSIRCDLNISVQPAGTDKPG
jgi:aspartyl-tRNA(Asn)/glutamyl-tRNA(Gln) amidotransferase subunit B